MSLKDLTDEEAWEIFNKLPASIQDAIADPRSGEINAALGQEFKLDAEQMQKLINLLYLIYGRYVSVSELKEALKKELRLKEPESRELTLKITQQRLWPLKDYLGGVENLIKSLGGDIPQKQRPAAGPQAETADGSPANPNPENISEKEDAADTGDSIVLKSVKAAMEENKEAMDQILTTQDIVLTSNKVTVKGSVKNWLTEYIQILGAGYHPNLDRIGFLYNNPNAKRLSDENRQLVGKILKSYDDGDTLPFSGKTYRLLIGKLKES